MTIVVRWLKVLAARLGRVLVAVGADDDGSERPTGPIAAAARRLADGSRGPGSPLQAVGEEDGRGPPAHWLAAIAAHDPALADPADPRWQGTAASDRREPSAPVVAPRQTRPAPTPTPTQQRPRARSRRRATRTAASRRPAADDAEPSPADAGAHVGVLHRVVAAARAAGQAVATAWLDPRVHDRTGDARDLVPATDDGPPTASGPDPSMRGAAPSPAAGGGDDDGTGPPGVVSRRARVGDAGPRWSPPSDRTAARPPAPPISWEDQPAASHPLPAWPDLPDEHGRTAVADAGSGGTEWDAGPGRGGRTTAAPGATRPAWLGPWPSLPDRATTVRLPGHQLTDRWRHEQERR